MSTFGRGWFSRSDSRPLAKGTRRKAGRADRQLSTTKLGVEQLEDRRMLAVLIGPGDDLEAINDALPPNGQEVSSQPSVTFENFDVNDGTGDPRDTFFYRAPLTGKLLVEAIGDGFVGFNVDVRDSTNTSLLGAPLGSGVATTVPVVQGQEYYIVVTDTVADGAGGSYSLELLNTSAPIPASVSLSPSSDTGASNNDNVTSDNTPTFFIQDDLGTFLTPPFNGGNTGTIDSNGANGYDVQLVATNLTTGAVTNVNATRIGTSATWTATTGVLPDGQYLVSAHTVVVDATSAGAGGANTGFSQLSVPIFVTIDAVPNAVVATITLDPTSDSGMLNTDGVTNINEPSFAGVGPQNSIVRLFAQPRNLTTGAAVGSPLLVATGTVGSDNTDGVAADGQGAYSLTSEPLDDGRYSFFVTFEMAGGLISPQFAFGTQLFIDTVAPNTPFLDLTTDTGRSNSDNITAANLPTFTMRSNATGAGGPTNPFANDVKYRLFVRPAGNIAAPETLIYDSFTDPAVGATFTTLASLTRTVSLNVNNPAGTVIPDGDHDFILEIEDRAGNISHDFLLPVTIDTIRPPVNFGLAATVGDGLFDGSDTGVSVTPATFADRVTSDSTPTLWGIAEANAIVMLFHDTTGNGFSADDTLLGQTVANPLDGNAALPTGYWQIESSQDLKLLNGGDGRVNLLAVALDVAGNALPPTSTNTDALTIFLDTQGPQITSVSVNAEANPNAGGFNLFDPKPQVNGHTPLVNSITINLRDLPTRLDGAGTTNDFLYTALDPVAASTVGNYSVVGDHVGQVMITSAVVNQAAAIVGPGTVTAAAAAGSNTVTDAAPNPAVIIGDFIVFNNGANSGITRRVTNAVGGVWTVDAPFPGAQAVGDGYSVIPAASILHAGALLPNTAFQSAVTSVANTTTTFTASNLFNTAAVGDYVRFNTGANAGQIRRVSAVAAGGTAIVVANGFGTAPAMGDTFALIDANNSGFGITQTNTASVTLTFAGPLPDDRFTVTVSDNLVDPAGNKLDGESNAVQPTAIPTFPTGDGTPGGAFAARFTIDSRPEIGSFVAQNINIDTNGNFVWDPAVPLGGDATNTDLKFVMNVANPATGAVAPGGYGLHDVVFAGQFTNGNAPNGGWAFDQLAVFGWSVELGGKRWLIDTNSDGVVTDPDGINVLGVAGDIISTQPAVPGFDISTALPFAGNFDGNLANGDEIGLYNAGTWAFDTNRNFVIDAADGFVTNGLLGQPIVGDFDGDGLDDLGVFNNNQFFFDISFNGSGNFIGNANADQTLNWGYPGVLDRPVASDMDQDGIDDIGLWVPGNTAQDNRPIAEWYFLISNDPLAINRIPGTINTLNHPFNQLPNVGFDLYAEFGDELALPIVGNFDPPVAATAGGNVGTQGGSGTTDFNNDGMTDGFDFLALQRGMGMNSGATTANGDANEDGAVNSQDTAMWQEEFGQGAPATIATTDSDLNGDGNVDGGDLGQWGNEFQQGSQDGDFFLAWQREATPSIATVSAATASSSTLDLTGVTGLSVTGVNFSGEASEITEAAFATVELESPFAAAAPTLAAAVSSPVDEAFAELAAAVDELAEEDEDDSVDSIITTLLA